MEQKRRVYLVFRETMTEYKFSDVFFTEEAAKAYIAKMPAHRRFYIEIFEETDNGLSKEIY